MEFSAPKKRQAGEPILPMINVVFLLLIFFLLSSQIAPRAPYAVTPPELESGESPAPEAVLFMAADGQLHFSGAEGGDALAAVAVQATELEVLTLRADAGVPAREVAALIARLRDAGIQTVSLTGTGS
ncbi:putative biopolymer transport protein (plasmid) [Phaeobacter inhibens]|uniref:ExbD/TolR family protein n=1 Tax=Phaeobacter inhibens TaxID=221822 RepID=UPI000C9C8A6D|nr:biopolymer transporter ExbD [Phaeobacter inhibens]AUR06004.1 putative biopolymer transport protein [Phaeobacter inhibens]